MPSLPAAQAAYAAVPAVPAPQTNALKANILSLYGQNAPQSTLQAFSQPQAAFGNATAGGAFAMMSSAPTQQPPLPPSMAYGNAQPAGAAFCGMFTPQQTPYGQVPQQQMLNATAMQPSPFGAFQSAQATVPQPQQQQQAFFQQQSAPNASPMGAFHAANVQPKPAQPGMNAAAGWANFK